MEIMILAKPSLLWNLLTNTDPFFSLFTVVSPPAVVFPLLPSATAGRTHHRDPSTGGDRLPCSRSWAYPEQSFLLCNPHRERHVEQRPLFAAPSCAAKHDQDVEEAFTQKRVYVCAGEWRFRRKNSVPRRRSPPGGVLRAASPESTPAPSQQLGSACSARLAHSPARPKTAKAEAAGLGRHPRPNSRPARLPQCGRRRGLCAAARRGSAAAAVGAGRQAPGSVSAGHTAGSPRKMDSLRRCALSAALPLHQLPQ
ncbi:uncharacterized protein LOC143692161 isoform X2 [Agelaius phoeniceus]|uniref:uncharacterized protein LOC143692161 isoform X2 n=1 Tax=Agelaius phoeniceus TaxID=39638 RepID=UPI0040552EF2